MAAPVLLTLSLTSARTGRFIDPASALPGRPGAPDALGSLNAIIRWFWRFLLLNDAIALVALLFMPFARPVQFYQSVWNFIPPGTQRFEILYRGTDPYHLLGNPVYFYRPPALVTTPFNEYSELRARLDRHETLFVFDPAFELPPEAQAIAQFCRAEVRTLPPWITHLNFNGWLERAHPWTLFRCQENG